MGKWRCSCGAENDMQFCGNCGQPMPPGADKQGSFLNRIGTTPLLIAAIMVVLAVSGLYGYFSSIESRYEEKLQNANVTLMEIHDILGDLNIAQGDKNSLMTESYRKRVESAKQSADELLSTFTSINTGKKYEAFNVDFVNALKLEAEIVANVDKVLKDPPGDALVAAKADPALQENVKKLAAEASKLQQLGMSFDTSMQFDDLVSEMNDYLYKYHAYEREKAKDAAKDKLAQQKRDIHSNLVETRRSIFTRNAADYIATDVNINGKVVRINGEFVNGTGKGGSRIDNLTLTMRLSYNGNTVYEGESFQPLVYLGYLPNGGTTNYTFVINAPDLPDDLLYDAFSVSVSF